MSPTGTNRRWACETRAKYDFFEKNLLFCVSRRGQVREPQSGTSNSIGKSFFAVSGVLASLLGNFARWPAKFLVLTGACQLGHGVGGFATSLIHSFSVLHWVGRADWSGPGRIKAVLENAGIE